MPVLGVIHNTVVLDQSIGWSFFHACSASAEELKSAILTALLCSSKHWWRWWEHNMRQNNWHTEFCIPHWTFASQELGLLASTTVTWGFVFWPLCKYECVSDPYKHSWQATVVETKRPNSWLAMVQCGIQNSVHVQLFCLILCSHHLHQCLDEHRRAVRMADFNSSVLAEHAWKNDHPTDWSNTTVLCITPRTGIQEWHRRLSVLEPQRMLWIVNLENFQLSIIVFSAMIS